MSWDDAPDEYERKSERLTALNHLLPTVVGLRVDPEEPLAGPLAKDRDHAVSQLLDAISRLASES